MTAVLDDPRTVAANHSVAPIVPLPRAGLSGAAIALICGGLGLVLFFTLDANRRAIGASRRAPVVAAGTITAPPALAVPALVQPMPSTGPLPRPPAPPPISPHAVPRMMQPAGSGAAPNYPPPPPIPMPVPQPPAGGATSDKVLVMDLGRGDPVGAVVADGKGEAPAGDDQAVRATLIRGRSSLVSQGTLIAAVLETPIDSTRAGLVRALVSRDVRGFDGSRVLIPRGSRLLGEAKGDAQPGQRRVLVTWTRLIRPDGVAIRIGSPGADSLGGAGLRGSVNTHFAERFANAVLQSALTVGVNLASRPRDGSVIVGLPNQLTGTVSQAPLFNVPTGPTIKVGKGAEIAVFVARDLDFGGVAPTR